MLSQEKSVREHLQVGRAARRWQSLVGVRWQRWQCRVAAFYFQRVSLPVQFWRAAVVLLSFVLVSRGGSLSCGGGCVSPAGCGRRSFRASAPPRPTPPTTDTAKQETNPAGQASRVPALLSLQTPSAKSWQATAELATLGRPQGKQRLTRRLFTALHSAPLPVGPAPVRNPHRAAEENESGGTAPGARREASLTLRCVPLRENRRDRREPRPAHHQS